MAYAFLKHELLEDEIFQNEQMLKLTVYLILKSPDGTLETSYGQIAKDTNIERNKVRRFLNKLNDRGIFEVTSDLKGTTVEMVLGNDIYKPGLIMIKK